MAKTRRLGGSNKHFRKRRATKNLRKRGRKSRRHTRKRYGGVPVSRVNRMGQSVSTHGMVRKPVAPPVAQSLPKRRITSTGQAISTHGMVRKPTTFKKSQNKGLLHTLTNLKLPKLF
jgi:hypothetical protein